MTMQFPPLPSAEGTVGSDHKSFIVQRLVPGSSYYSGRTSAGNACLLIKTSDLGRTVPLVLAGLEAYFGVPCLIREPESADRTETLTALICVHSSTEVEAYFGRVCDGLVAQLGELPSAESAERGIQSLVELFRKLSAPASRSLTGIAGELCVIHEASDPAVAVRAWRNDDFDKHDFASQTLRLEAKATSTRLRKHSFALDQLHPPVGCQAFVASVFIEHLQQGISLAEFMDAIEARLHDLTSVAKLRTIFADSMGEQLPAALEWRFDLQLARQSFAFFRSDDIPRLAAQHPPGVSDVRFTSDMSSSPPIKEDVWANKGWSVAGDNGRGP